jgi:hypothetical protein
MLPRCFVLFVLILAPSLAARPDPNIIHFGQNFAVAPDQTIHNATCFLCSTDVAGHATGTVHVFAGNVSLTGSVAGNVVIFGGNLTLSGGATIGGHVFILGGRLYSGTIQPAHTVFAPIIFLPLTLLVCAIIGALIVVTRRSVRGPVIFPPLPRL